MNATAENVQMIFYAAIEKRSPEQRRSFLDDACAENAELRARVEELLAAHMAMGSIHERGSPPGAVTLDHHRELSGTLIGPYKLLEQIGEGGMGVVYVAEQTEPVRRRVALKIIKPGMDTKQVIARFEAERQALAMMDHPNIARVLDAGTTEAGRPYFVMELVRGMPITEYCDKTRLSPRQRLELFVDVCRAVQHAHQKGIIHRDLKPSNVMVTLHDGTPVVKVIDFGVAKAVGQQLTERTIYTALTQLVGTPLYMSPEQAEMSGLDVDTRSDVYSLGVLLYELLTGQTPFDKETLSKAGLDEMRRIIREDEPLRPSRRFSTLGAQAISTISQHRSLDERRLSKVLCGELDWIVMKSLEKDRSRRYESASALATDIQRYLSDEPVLACPPTTMYRFQKFARKHKPALATAAAVAATLLLGTTVSAWQAVRATTAEAQANANEAQAKAAAAAEAQQRQRAEANEQKANTQRDEVKALNDRLQRTLYASNMNLAKHAWDAGGIGRAKELLDQYRPEPGETDLRSFEWHYLNRLMHSGLLTLEHGGHVNCVTYSPDGKRLASAGDGTVKVWDALTGRELLSFQGESASAVAFSSDGKRLAHSVRGGENGEWKVRDAETGAELLTLKGSYNIVTFSPDGKRLAGSGREVKVWEAERGEEVLTVPGSYGYVVFSPDSNRLATTGEEVKIWDSKTGEQLLKLKGYSWHSQSVAFSPDGNWLAGAFEDTTVKIWNARTGDEVRALDNRGASTVFFSQDSKHLAVGSWRGIVRILDVETGQAIRTIRGAGNSVALSPDGERLSSNVGITIKIWDVTKDQESIIEKDEAGRRSPDNRLVARKSRGNTIKIEDAASGQELLTLKGHAVAIWKMAFSPDGKRLASGGGGNSDQGVSRGDHAELKIWDTKTGQEVFNLPVASATVIWNVTFSPDGKHLASGSGPGTIPGQFKVWDVQNGQELFSLQGHTSAGISIAYSPDGKRIATTTAHDKTVKLWDAQSGQELLSLPGPSGFPQPLIYSPNGKRLACGGTEGAKVWDAETGLELLALKGHTSNIRGFAFSPDGARLATCSNDQTIKLWDAQTGQELLTLEADWPDKVAFSPDGNHLISNQQSVAKIYDATPLPEKP